MIAALEARGLRVDPGLRHRPRRAAGDRAVLLRGRPADGRRGGLADRLLAGRRPGLQRRQGRRGRCWRALDVPYLAAHPGRVPDARAVGGVRARPAAGRGDDDGRDPRARRRHRLDGVRRPLGRGRRPSGCATTCRSHRASAPRDARRAAGRAKLVGLRRTSARRAQGRDRALQLPAQCRQHRHGRLSGRSSTRSIARSRALQRDGYTVEVPGQRRRAARADHRRQCRSASAPHANVHARIPVDDHVRRERWLARDRGAVGPGARPPAERRRLDLRARRALRQRVVGVQPAFGYEGDPMRLLFEKGFAPTHAFSAFYRYLREDFGAHAVLHFGTHGALEFMPGKQAGLSGACWPDRLIGDLPNLYLYASNNPSEGTIAKRRAAATLISYLTPAGGPCRPLSRASLDLKASLERWRGLAAGDGRRARRSGAADPGPGRRARPRRRRAVLGRRRRRRRSRSSAPPFSSSNTR